MNRVLLCFLLLLLAHNMLPAQSAANHTKEIVVFCKVWGFLKYYHPEVATGKFDWDKEFITRVNTLPSFSSKEQASAYYINWIGSLGKIKRSKHSGIGVPDSLKFNLDLSWLDDTAIFTPALITTLHAIQHSPGNGKHYYVQAYPFVGNTYYKHEKLYPDSVYPTAGLRLLTLARYWNMVNYFYPYKFSTPQPWHSVLTEMVPLFKYAADSTAYHLAILQLIGKIADSHCEIVTLFGGNTFGNKWAPFRFKIIDNKAIVTGFYNDSLCRKNDIRTGDVFTAINGKPIANVIDRLSPYVGASNKEAQLHFFKAVLFNGNTDTLAVTCERNGVITNKIIYRYDFKDFKYIHPLKDTSAPYKLLPENIGYVNMGALMPGQVSKTLNALRNTRAIIFDVRNYPNGTMFKVAQFLDPVSKPFVKFFMPRLNSPGVYDYSVMTCGSKNAHAYKGKVILLCDARTMSHGEFTLMALQTAPNVTIIGSQTAGADGNVSDIPLPGNYRTYFTGIGVCYPNGTATQRTGIVPDITIEPTIEGVRQGRDEVLEKAIEIINSH